MPEQSELGLIDLSRALRFRARKRPYQKLAGELAMNLTFYAENRPDPAMWAKIKKQFEELDDWIVMTAEQ